ncbi:MAG: GNAT family N-acetyltransferase [Chloroflexota bacterium]
MAEHPSSIRTEYAPPNIEDYLHLRNITGLGYRSPEAASKGLPNSLFAVTLYEGNKTVGMGRVVGDGGCNFEIVDIAVVPDYQGKGLGYLIMQEVMNYIDSHAPEGSYICLIASVPELYEKFGFQKCAPRNEGMFIKR